uniref:Uncharacterized protein n=1 Tax=Anguilla anguilla TaxID=7936 RepID=A0A0E9WCL9_ANGAN
MQVSFLKCLCVLNVLVLCENYSIVTYSLV